MPFDLQPVLKGNLVVLRPLEPGDFDALFAVASDPLIWEQHPAYDRYKIAVFQDYFQTGLESGGAFLVTDAKDGRVIGSTRYHGYGEQRSEIEIGWTFLARTHWGGAHNGEMKRLLLEHAFQFVRHVVFLVGPHNQRSRRALEKIDAVEVGSRKDAKGRDSVVYRITSSTWDSRP